jgi:hypothetical protein
MVEHNRQGVAASPAPTWSMPLGTAPTWPIAWRADCLVPCVKMSRKRSWRSTKPGTRPFADPYSPQCVKKVFLRIRQVLTQS